MQQTNTQTNLENENISFNAFIEHSPVNITKNEDFDTYNFTGDGSMAFPYVIENLNITTEEEYGIFIKDVDVYFEITGCYIYAKNPIYAENVPDVEAFIISNILKTTNPPLGFSNGITLLVCHGFQIIGNTFLGPGDSGFYADTCYNAIIEDNYFTKFYNSIDIINCGAWEITGNYFEKNDGDQYVNSDFLEFSNNTWINNTNGLYLGGCINCYITNNFLLYNTYLAVTLYSCDDVFVYSNWFVENNLLGASQAQDTSGMNQWCWSLTDTGNFWSDYSGSGSYWIYGDQYDPYPIFDSDKDGLNDYEELFVYLTDKDDTDSDDDLMPDGYEVENGLNPLLDDSDLDLDNDDLKNYDEYLYGTSPQVEDSDSDLINDGYEVINGLNPLMNDAALDFDGDGLTNLQESQLGTQANNYDSDKDGMCDFWEVQNSLNPLLNDAWMDSDNDGLNNFFEYIYGCDPNEKDSDSDSYSDGWEILQGTNPNDPNDYPATTEPTDNSSTEETTFFLVAGILAIFITVNFTLLRSRHIKKEIKQLLNDYFPK